MRGDTWIINVLPEILVEDWYNLYIYSEYDLQVATYHWLRREFDKNRSVKWIVRTQPIILLKKGSVKPDIVIYKNTIPYDIFELKCQMNGFRESELQDDLDKFYRLKKEWNIRHAYQLVLYDDEVIIELPTYRKEDWMKNFLTFISVNIRRSSTGRRRNNYDEAIKRWQRYK